MAHALNAPLSITVFNAVVLQGSLEIHFRAAINRYNVAILIVNATNLVFSAPKPVHLILNVLVVKYAHWANADPDAIQEIVKLVSYVKMGLVLLDVEIT